MHVSALLSANQRSLAQCPVVRGGADWLTSAKVVVFNHLGAQPHNPTSLRQQQLREDVIFVTIRFGLSC